MIFALGVALGVGLASDGGSAPAPPPARPTGFDHIIHDSQVVVAGAEPLECTACHALDRRGRIAGAPGHATCFGACHGPAPRGRGRATVPEDARARLVCESCHAAATLDALAAGQRVARAALRPGFPFGTAPDFTVAMSHAAHAAPSAAAGDCAACHDVARAGAPAGPPHARCADCHTGGDAPAMTACDTCHRAGFGPNMQLALARGPFPVGDRFSHQRHLARAPRPACRDCHAAAAQAAGARIPAPNKATCRTCHDGAAAFDTRAEQCRRCHAAPDVERPGTEPVDRARYSHAQHAGIADDCGACHALGPRGAALPPGGHAACSADACHGTAFATDDDGIAMCSACHIGAEPWRPLHRDPLPPAGTEFGARFSHAAHAARGASDCAACHGERARGHAGCAGDACHAREGGSPPALTECAACHERGVIERRVAAAARAPWSVRARFTHDRHDGACTDCHLGVERASGIDDVPTPPKRTCAPCHDGTTAFKLTGHDCARCHAR